jgi:hypothetical protein
MKSRTCISWDFVDTYDYGFRFEEAVGMV